MICRSRSGIDSARRSSSALLTRVIANLPANNDHGQQGRESRRLAAQTAHSTGARAIACSTRADTRADSSLRPPRSSHRRHGSAAWRLPSTRGVPLPQSLINRIEAAAVALSRRLPDGLRIAGRCPECECLASGNGGYVTRPESESHGNLELAESLKFLSRQARQLAG